MINDIKGVLVHQTTSGGVAQDDSAPAVRKSG